MHRRSLLTLLSALLLSSQALAGYRLVEAPSDDDPMRVHMYRLDNGLTVYLTENHQEPRFHAEIAVRAGSVNDPDDLTGMAHYMEHMLFKGTSRIGSADYDREKVHLDRIEALYEERFAETDSLRRAELYARINDEVQRAAAYAIPNELDRLYTAMGEHGLNAGTDQEFIFYRVDLPANRLPQWARIEAERFRDPVFRLFQTELETVYEEFNMRLIDNKRRLISSAVDALLYRNHPYGTSVLGTIEDLHNPSIKHMLDFYHTYYVPNNMAVLISGDIDPEAAIRVIDAEMSVWEPGKLPRPRSWKEEKIESVRRDTVYYPGEERVLIAFRTEPSTHKKTETLQLLDYILDNAAAGLINLNLNQQQRVRQAGSSTTSHRISNDYGAQYLWGIPKEGQSLEEVEQLLLEQIELIEQGEFEEWLIPAIVTDFKKTRKRQLETNSSRVGMMREAFIARQDWDHALAKLERMGKVSKRDVVKAARRYFRKGYAVGYRMDGKAEIPPIERPNLDKIDIDAARQSPFLEEILAMPFEEIEPVYLRPGQDYVRTDLRDAVELYYARNPLNDLFSLSIAVEVGTLTEPRLAVAGELLDKSGTSRLSPEELKKEWYKLGTSFSLNVGDQGTTLSISGLDENFAESLSLLVEVLGDPVADEEALAELKLIVLKNREDAKKDHRTIHRALYHYNRFGDMAYFRRILPNADLELLTVDELLGLVRSLTGYEQTISYTGSLSLEQVRSALTEAYPLPTELKSTPPYRVMDIRAPAETEIYFLDKEMAQAQVRIDFGDVPFRPQLMPSGALFNEYFYGGSAGIVFQELREARALAYSAWAWYFDGNRAGDQNLMSGFIGTQADKTTEAVEVFIELMDDMPVSEERFTGARRALISKHRTERLGFRQVLGTVQNWTHKGIDADPRPERFARIQEATLKDVTAFYQDHVQGRPKLISIVGDRNKIDLQALGLQGKVVELRLDDVFAF